MRKEIIGIILFFLVIFTLVSLVSFSPDDPSINNAFAGGKINNLFGAVGAHIAGAFTGFFGIGAFWIPVLLFLSSIQFFGSRPKEVFLLTFFGGIILIVSTGAIVSLIIYPSHFITILGKEFSSGGFAGISFTHLLVKYARFTGALFILTPLWIIGLMMATGFSFIKLGKLLFKIYLALSSRLSKIFGKIKNRAKKQKDAVSIDTEIKADYEEKKEPKIEYNKDKENEPFLENEPNINIDNNTEPEPTPEPVSATNNQINHMSQKAPEKIEIRKLDTTTKVPKSALKEEVFEVMQEEGFSLPSIEMLEDPQETKITADDENLKKQSILLEKKLEDFGVKGRVAAISPGPVITTFEYEPAPGVKINKIVNLSDDLALALRSMSIRIVAPIPGKSVIGIEIPNTEREIVRLKEIIASDEFKKPKSKLTLCLGKDIIGRPVTADLAKMPHLLIAGATGTGKSVALNTMICSLLYKAVPDQVKFIMIDPKRIEMSNYDGIPHLISPVVTDVKKATNALFWAVREMEQRYELLAEKRAKNIGQYNAKAEESDSDEEPFPNLPYIVIIIDELADLMMVASRDVEVSLARLAQMARAAGIHLILATQRPSVDVLTGLIKANFPTRITFQVSSKTDSRTIIDSNGAETLLGNGDMLYLGPGTAKLKRIHGAYISETENDKIISFLKAQQPPQYDESVTCPPVQQKGSTGEEDYDEKYDEAVALVTKTGQASISMVQRHLRIGYNRAARIIEIMEREGVVGPSDGVKPREVLVRSYDDS